MIASKRTLVIGDIHGGLKALEQVWKRANISEEDTLVFLGDYGDGWSESAAVVSFLIAKSNTHSCVFIRGNHDYLVHRYLTKNDTNPMWLQHGGDATMKSYQEISEEMKKAHISFFEALQNYHVDTQNRLFVHAGFTHQAGPRYEFYPNLVYWDRTLWETACSLDPTLSKKSDRYPQRLLQFKEMYIGHTPTTRVGETVPTQYANVWNIDTGAAFKGCLSVLDIATKKFWQSDPVYTLYPEEKGRN
ncbi:MAG: serine/threonine protein phosphatase 1 [Patiriisocius sp.]|jgi:serine/threonine protein phosphatase 1